MTPMLLNKFRDAKLMGLTLVELLVVMAVLSLLTAGIVPGLTAQVRRANILATQQEITALRDALRLYYEDVDAFPPTGNLKALIDPAEVPAAHFPRWRGPYIISTTDLADYRQDAWDVAYDYAVTSVPPPIASVRSAGPDRSLGTTADNITQGVAAQDLKMAKRRRVQAELEVIARAAQAYAVAKGGYPATIDDLYGAMVPTVAYHLTGPQDGDFGVGFAPPAGDQYCALLWPGSVMATATQLAACVDADACSPTTFYWRSPPMATFPCTNSGDMWQLNFAPYTGTAYKGGTLLTRTCHQSARVVCVNSAATPTVYLLDESYRTDAWGNDYVRNGIQMQFKSRGPDGANGGGDDISP